MGTTARYDVASTRELSEVVVTALGIEKDKRTLGYATQEIQGAAVAAKSEPNVLNALQGKVSGVNITGASGLAGTSTNINIRGITSLTGSNQPLFAALNVVLTPNIPQRLLYPPSEVAANGDKLPTVGIADRVWWATN